MQDTDPGLLCNCDRAAGHDGHVVLLPDGGGQRGAGDEALQLNRAPLLRHLHQITPSHQPSMLCRITTQAQYQGF